jgi:hypothetical protein
MSCRSSVFGCFLFAGGILAVIKFSNTNDPSVPALAFQYFVLNPNHPFSSPHRDNQNSTAQNIPEPPPQNSRGDCGLASASTGELKATTQSGSAMTMIQFISNAVPIRAKEKN